jgi:glucosylceramidase
VPLDIRVNTSAAAGTHPIEGFGGCFNEKGWDALAVLEAPARTAVLESLFGAEGLRWGLNRMPVGSSDFADSYYSLDDSAGDLALANLSLARDREKLLPFIHAAAAVNPQLTLWGSPWSAPTWMKDSAPQMPHNEGCGSLALTPAVRVAYAEYLARAALAYRAEGLRFEHLAVQNEPNQGDTWHNASRSCHDSYPKMHWTGEALRDFVRDYLGPAFAAHNLSGTVGILLSTFPVNEFESYVQPALADEGALAYLAGVGLQYAGVGMVGAIRAAAPWLKTWETETPCGGGGACLGGGAGSWSWGQVQFSYMRSFLAAGASVYSQWNMILDESGKSGWGWSQCAPVTVHSGTGDVVYEGSYWATKHFSYFVAPGAVVLETTGDNAPCAEVNDACGCAGGCTAAANIGMEAISFRNPDGGLVLVAQNNAGAGAPVNLFVDGRLAVSEVLPPHSMNTFTIDPPVN